MYLQLQKYNSHFPQQIVGSYEYRGPYFDTPAYLMARVAVGCDWSLTRYADSAGCADADS
jgi:hypothetical protein